MDFTMRLITILSFLVSMVWGCTDQENKKEEIRDFPEVFKKGLSAHGGLEKWNSYGTLHFNEVSNSDTTSYTIDLKSRNEIIEKSGHYKVGFTSDSIYFYPNRDSFPSENPRFMHNLRFYFFAISFVTADPGTFQEALEPAELNGHMYDRVKITFDNGVGIAPKDQYILWYNQTDHKLFMINYSVTYFNEQNAEKYSAIIYNAWIKVDGLQLPTEMIGYKWENNSLGEERYRRKFTDISLSKERPDPRIFIDLN